MTFNYQTDRVLRDEIHLHEARIMADLADRLSPNTLAGRGFARTVHGKRYVETDAEPDQWRPIVWGAVIAGCLLFWVGAFAALPHILGAAIAVGDFLGITAR